MSGLANLNGFSLAKTTAYTESQVAKLNAANALVGGLAYGPTTITAAGNTILDVTTPITLLDTTLGAQALSLPNGQNIGQQKQFIKIINNGTSILTPTNFLSALAATIEFPAGTVGETVTLVWTGAAWALVSRAGGGTTANAAAAATYSVLA